MYWKEISMLISWPVSIYISYIIIKWVLKKFDGILNTP
jgi:hypothetical protein